jgi:ferritin-like metal-binding protein YciE
MELESLRELYITELKDLYSAEGQLGKALPKMANRATSPELKQAFEAQLEDTKQHVRRLDRVFETLEASPGGKHCKGMEVLIEEVEKLVEEGGSGDVLDAALISKAQHAEHYKIAGYGTVRTYAIILGEIGHLRLFQQTLHEEAVADDWLTDIAQELINREAATRDENGETRQANRDARDREVTRPAEFDRLSL